MLSLLYEGLGVVLHAKEVEVSRRYRDIAAWRLGRPLKPWEVVHHIDGHHDDDHPDNLAVLPNPTAHALLHWYERREARGVQHLWPLQTWLDLHLQGQAKAA